MATRVAITMEYELDARNTDDAAREVRELFNQRFAEHHVTDVELDGVFVYPFKPVNSNPFVTAILTGPNVDTIAHAFNLAYNGFTNDNEDTRTRDTFAVNVH